MTRINTNCFYRNMFGEKVSPFSELKRSDLEVQCPRGTKGLTELVLAEDIFENPSDEQRNIFNGYWLSKFHKKEIISKGLQADELLEEYGLDKETTDQTIEFSYQNIARIKKNAQINETHGKIASLATDGSLILGIVKNVFSDLPILNFLKIGINVLYGFTKSIRSYNQYTIYNQNDDDAALNRFQADVYGNKLVGALANASTFTERKINSWAYTALELIPDEYKKYKEIGKKVAGLPTSLWWRSRLATLINQQFFTDFLTYLVHKPLSVLWSERSKEKIEDIKKKGNLDTSYIFERHCKNVGILDKKQQTFRNLISELGKQVKNLFSTNIKVQKEASKKVSDTLSPFLGVYGFFASGIGTVAGSMLKLFNKDSKIFDFISNTAQMSQQMYYFPKMVMPMLTEVNDIKSSLLDKEVKKRYGTKQLEEIKIFCDKKKNLAYVGVGTFLLNLVNTVFKLKEVHHPFLKKGKELLDTLTGDLVSKFFSQRRYLIGQGFRIQNPEFYEEVVESTKVSFCALTEQVQGSSF